MKRILLSAGLAIALACMLWLVTGCDTPNTPDLPSQPYHLVRAYDLGGSVEYVQARGDYVAVANGSYGADVFRNTGADTLTHVFSYVISEGSYCTCVALDIVHSYLGVYDHPNTQIDWPVYDFRVANMDSAVVRNMGSFTIGPPTSSFDVWPRSADTIVFLGNDYTVTDRRLTSTTFSRTSDTALWYPCGCECPSLQPSGQPRGFTIRQSDGVVFAAVEDMGVMVWDYSSCGITDTIGTPGVAYDCALAGDILVIADEYSVQIAQLTDPMHGEVIYSLIVGSSSTARAHRLRHVTVDGQFACVADDIEGVFIIDISNPTNPTSVQLLSMHDVMGVSSDGHGNLYVACPEQGFLHYRR